MNKKLAEEVAKLEPLESRASALNTKGEGGTAKEDVADKKRDQDCEKEDLADKKLAEEKLQEERELKERTKKKLAELDRCPMYQQWLQPRQQQNKPSERVKPEPTESRASAPDTDGEGGTSTTACDSSSAAAAAKPTELLKGYAGAK